VPANLRSPGDDARLDLTDLYVFSSPDHAERTVMIIDSNPFLAGSEFHPDAVHRINVDTDGDALADIAFTFAFSQPKDGRQTMTASYGVGEEARRPEPGSEVLIRDTPVSFDQTTRVVPAGACRLFVGVRSDPFFADVEGVLHNFQWTGQDTFAGKNILSIALEVPNDMLGAGPEIGVWATVSLRRDGKLLQMDRGGNPSFNPILMPDDLKDGFNARQPVDDVKNYLETQSHFRQSQGYGADEAKAVVLSVLPDILHFDRRRPASYPNGRAITDDVFSARMAFMTHGKVTSQGLKPHDDLLMEFPFLGVPNPPSAACGRREA
jgi:hypothetical protein